MTSLVIERNLPDNQSNVTIATKLDGYTIKWDAQETGETVEVWQHTSNVRSSATLVATVADTYYDSTTLIVGTTYYVWTRRISSLGVPGDWDLGETAGRSIMPVGTTTRTELTSTSGVDIDASYGSWKTISTHNFTGTGNEWWIRGSLFLATSGNSVVFGSAFYDTQVLGRFRIIRDPSGTPTDVYVGPSIVMAQFTFYDFNRFGDMFDETLISTDASVTYQVLFEANRTRVDAADSISTSSDRRKVILIEFKR